MPSRSEATHEMIATLSQSTLCGPPTNLDFLQKILKSPEFNSGHTLTSFLASFSYTPSAIDVIKAGAYTLVQDYPGRPAIGKGIPHSGPMVFVSYFLTFRIADFSAGFFSVPKYGPVFFSHVFTDLSYSRKFRSGKPRWDRRPRDHIRWPEIAFPRYRCGSSMWSCF